MAGIEIARGDNVIYSHSDDLKIEQIVDIICKIEQEIYDQTECEYFNVTVFSNGFVEIVEFLGIQIWNSDDDTRRYIEVGELPNGLPDEVRESFEVFLRRTINEELEKIKKIKL